MQRLVQVMRVLCIIDCLGSGGAQRQMVYLACGLKQQGHDVEMFLTHPDGAQFYRPQIDAAGIPVHGVSRRGGTGFSLKVLFAIRRELARGFEGVVSYQLSANGYAVIARLLTRGCHARMVCGERSSNIKVGSLVRKVAVWATGILSDALVANSHSHGSYLARLPGLAHRVHVIWNGYPICLATSAPSRSQDPSTPLILVVGRRAPVKNGLRLFEALQLVQQRYGWTPRLRWAGAQQTDQASLETSRDIDRFLEHNLALAQSCSFLGEVGDPTTLYQTSDVLILPSLYEGLPNVVCEAMLEGCPVIASNVCDHPRLLGEGERGLLCDPQSPESIADAIERLRTMTVAERAQMATRARRFAETHLSMDVMVDQYDRLLQGLSIGVTNTKGMESPI
jgi:glycosyltransferase involved in cell wall biosynthesis